MLTLRNAHSIALIPIYPKQIVTDYGPLQVVTDSPIHLPEDKRIIETVVPSSYKTKSGALNKARALQYCLGKAIFLLTH